VRLSPSDQPIQPENVPLSFSSITLNDDGLNYQSSLDVSPLLVIDSRSTYDNDADEFCRNRRKLEVSIKM